MAVAQRKNKELTTVKWPQMERTIEDSTKQAITSLQSAVTDAQRQRDAARGQFISNYGDANFRNGQSALSAQIARQQGLVAGLGH